MWNLALKSLFVFDIYFNYIVYFLAGIIILYLSDGFKYFNSVCRTLYFKVRYDVKTTIANTDEECVLYTKQLINRCKQFPVLGLDCEWVSQGKHRGAVALLQLATPDGYTSIFRLNKIKTFPSCLLELLGSSSIIKVGVGVVKDGNHLNSDYGLVCKGFLDLRYVAGCGDGLAKLSRSHLGITLDKDWHISASNWEAQELSARQIEYAAQDARVAVLVFTKLNYRIIRGKTWYWKKSQLTDNDLWEPTYKHWLPFIDHDYTKKSYGTHQKALNGKNILSKEANNRKLQTRSYSMRQKPLYENIFLQAPDGELLCTCNTKKVEWYQSKGLGKWVSDNPKSFRLFFEPAGRDATGYYSKEKNNICVVCGTDQTYLRKNIVPFEYRKHFPVDMKSHQSHDVLLVCLQCHMKSNNAYINFKDYLATLCDAPVKSSEDFEFCKAKSAARALDNNSTVIPLTRKNELKETIKMFLRQEEITENDIKQLKSIATQNTAAKHDSHGWKVVQHFKQTGGGIQALETLWRKHFIETMQPKYLPQLWSINYNHYLS